MKNLKKLFLILVLASSAKLLNSQVCQPYVGCNSCVSTSTCNLVCNGSFESIGGDNSGLPQAACEIEKACGWGAHKGTPDFFHSGGVTNFNVPCNFRGGENNHTTGTGIGG